MTPYLIFDIAILVILAVFVIRGAYRGFLLSLCGLLAVIVAFVGANLVSDALAPKVADYLEPKFAQAIETRLEQEMQDALPSPDEPIAGDPSGEQNVSLDVILDILKDMGLYQSAVDAIDKTVQTGMTDVAAGTAAAVAASVAGTVAHMVIFGAAFVLILILWTLLSHALDLVAHLPGLHALNKTGGALLGLIKGCMLLFLCAWALRYLGNIIPEEAVEKTRLLNFFMTTNPVALVFGG